MLKSTFRLNDCLRFVIYARMSSDQQNERSPEQQIDEVWRTVRLVGHPWREVRRPYIDRALSGRLTRRRPEYQRMFNDIASGAVQCDVVLVDNAERFSRADTAVEERAKLARLGVLMLTADSHFSDPTTDAGQLFAMFEAFRARGENRVKAHNVLRGKRDKVKLKEWPGGPIPLGYKIVDQRLEPDERTAWIVRLAYEIADKRGFGMTRVAQALTDHPDVPNEFKPLNDKTIGRILKSTLYIGTYEFNKVAKDIVRDVHVTQRNPREEWEIVTEYCQPLVAVDVYERVNSLRKLRAKKITDANPDAYGHMSYSGSGVALKYLLSGLVICGECGRAMTVSVTAPYTTKNGKEKVYRSYRCPGRNSRGCFNQTGFQESWLRETVIGWVRDRLTGRKLQNGNAPISMENVAGSEWFRELVDLVGNEVRRKEQMQPADEEIRKQRIEVLNSEQRGRIRSLSDEHLNDGARRALGEAYAEAERTLESLRADEAEWTAQLRRVEKAIDPSEVARNLMRLSDVLATANVSAGNVILGLHIESVRCFSPGRIVARFCKLGALGADIEFIRDAQSTAVPEHEPRCEGLEQVIQRRRTHRNTCQMRNDSDQVDSLNYFAMDPNRFVGFSEEWFESLEAVVPVKSSWVEMHALEVASFRLRQNVSIDRTAEHFQKSVPTIRKALKRASELGIDAGDAVVQLRRKPNWAADHSAEVAEYLKLNNCTIKAAASHFGKSEPTISKALDIARDREQSIS